MCGITGSFSRRGFFTDDDLKQMTYRLSHRGPDGDGFYSDHYVKLGHRRLSILDLDVRASQPMATGDGRYIIAFNGEIYNYIELRDQIKQANKGTSLGEFKTTGDTEVVLRLFEIYGVSGMNQLNGMFAVAIYDSVLKNLFVFRDRLGIKPLFYYSDPEGNFCFASELKALQGLQKLALSINKEAVYDFLGLGFIPAPSTIYTQISKLKSGSYLQVSSDGIVEKTYWNLNDSFAQEPLTDEKKVLNELESLLHSSVKMQLRSDVPYGVFLSGGIDSSLVTAIASGFVNEKLNTFSIGFLELSHNESTHAQKIARQLGTAHHEFIVSYEDALKMVETYFDIYDEPYADSSGINAMLISRLASQHVKVVLSGEGGDELFYGYGSHSWARRLDHTFLSVARNPIRLLFERGSSRYQRIASMLEYNPEIDFMPEHIYGQEQYFFNRKEIGHLLSNSHQPLYVLHHQFRVKELKRAFANTNRKLSAIESQTLYEIQFPLQDDLLTKVDRATMHYSIEARVPLLDHRIAEFANRISPALKIKNGIAKYPLKQILYTYLPKELFDRPKQGFSIPLAQWLNHEWSYLLDDYLTEQNVTEAGFVKFEYVQNYIQRFRHGETFLYNRLWNLVVLHRWFARNK